MKKTRKPEWLRRSLPTKPEYERVRRLMSDLSLHTVCQEARCPNLWECFSCKTATFLILGEYCTRNCRFCAVKKGVPLPPDPSEPQRVAEAAEKLGLSHVVVTSVTRDDLSDGGASMFAATITALRKRLPDAFVEVLIPDFRGDADALKAVLDAGPHVFNHNVETVPGLYRKVRPRADYERSLAIFRNLGRMSPDMIGKSGLMLGLGERETEIEETLSDLCRAGVRILTLGQYLQPSANHLPVERYVTPEEFERWKERALHMGFAAVSSGPFVRSSYKAGELLSLRRPCRGPNF